jgi:hypothetical protein
VLSVNVGMPRTVPWQGKSAINDELLASVTLLKPSQGA